MTSTPTTRTLVLSLEVPHAVETWRILRLLKEVLQPGTTMTALEPDPAVPEKVVLTALEASLC